MKYLSSHFGDCVFAINPTRPGLVDLHRNGRVQEVFSSQLPLITPLDWDSGRLEEHETLTDAIEASRRKRFAFQNATLVCSVLSLDNSPAEFRESVKTAVEKEMQHARLDWTETFSYYLFDQIPARLPVLVQRNTTFGWDETLSVLIEVQRLMPYRSVVNRLWDQYWQSRGPGLAGVYGSLAHKLGLLYQSASELSLGRGQLVADSLPALALLQHQVGDRAELFEGWPVALEAEIAANRLRLEEESPQTFRVELPGFIAPAVLRPLVGRPRSSGPQASSFGIAPLLGLHLAQRPTLSEEQVSEFRSRFVIEPLEPGFGYTLGNSLRRTLLSLIPGAAVTSIRIDGVLHEFSTVAGVKEDVTEVILNIKNLVVSSEHDEPITAYLRKQGAGEVTAADISAPAGVEIHNPELVIATLNDKAKFELQLTIERGRGYVSATQNRSEFSEAGQIPIDSIYSPVLKVTYRVEATRAGERTDFDRLVVDVETKSGITPRDAVDSAGRTLTEIFGLARELNTAAEGIDFVRNTGDPVADEEPGMLIEDLDLSVRSYSALKRESINTVDELVSLSYVQLLNIRNFGQKSVDEVNDKLAELGLTMHRQTPGLEVTYWVEDDPGQH